MVYRSLCGSSKLSGPLVQSHALMRGLNGVKEAILMQPQQNSFCEVFYQCLCTSGEHHRKKNLDAHPMCNSIDCSPSTVL